LLKKKRAVYGNQRKWSRRRKNKGSRETGSGGEGSGNPERGRWESHLEPFSNLDRGGLSDLKKRHREDVVQNKNRAGQKESKSGKKTRERRAWRQKTKTHQPEE